MSEQVTFRGSLTGKVSGEPLSQRDVDFREAWPKISRQRYVLAADTTTQTLNLGPITTAKVIQINAEHPVYLTINHATTAAHRWQCRGNLVAQISSTTVMVENVSSANTNEVDIFMAGI